MVSNRWHMRQKCGTFTNYYVKNNCATPLSHTVSLIFCATLYIVNVPHFCLMCHMFRTICPMFYNLSITLFTFLKALLCLCVYLPLIHLVVLKRTRILIIYIALYIKFISQSFITNVIIYKVI